MVFFFDAFALSKYRIGLVYNIFIKEIIHRRYAVPWLQFEVCIEFHLKNSCKIPIE
jgi:hypothetical protein